MNPEERIITWDELALHAEIRNHLWVLIDGRVYDVTSYLTEHPGGDDILMNHAGLDASIRYTKVGHSDYAISLRNARLVGLIEDKPQPDDHVSKVKKSIPKAVHLNPDQVLEWDEIIKHKQKNDLWVVVNKKAYNLTEFQNEHPGGTQILLKYSGTNATERYNEVNHSATAKRKMVDFQVGQVLTDEKPQSSTSLKFAMFFVGLVIAYLYNQFFKEQSKTIDK